MDRPIVAWVTGLGKDIDSRRAYNSIMAHEHSHQTRRAGSRRRLWWTLILIVGYLVAEVVGGLLTHSLALLADAGHMFSDAAALGLSLFALGMAERPATPQRSYGFYRAEILGALINGASLLAVSVWILYEAWQRLWEPPEVKGGLMFVIAVGGLLVNLFALWLLNDDKGDNLNMRGAWLHILGDALGSVAAIVGAVLIWAFDWNWADPVASALIGLLVVHSTWNLMCEAVAVLMEGTPGHIDPDAVRTTMGAVPGVQGVHDLHIWTISSGIVALSGHVVAAETVVAREMLKALREVLHERFEIDHVTIQIEPPDFRATEVCEHK